MNYVRFSINCLVEAIYLGTHVRPDDSYSD